MRLFERGAVFLRRRQGSRRSAARGRHRGGRARAGTVGHGQDAADFFDLKSDVMRVLELAGAAVRFQWQPAELACLHPGRSATVVREGQVIGWLGELHPIR